MMFVMIDNIFYEEMGVRRMGVSKRRNGKLGNRK